MELLSRLTLSLSRVLQEMKTEKKPHMFSQSLWNRILAFCSLIGQQYRTTKDMSILNRMPNTASAYPAERCIQPNNLPPDSSHHNISQNKENTGHFIKCNICYINPHCDSVGSLTEVWSRKDPSLVWRERKRNRSLHPLEL